MLSVGVEEDSPLDPHVFASSQPLKVHKLQTEQTVTESNMKKMSLTFGSQVGGNKNKNRTHTKNALLDKLSAKYSLAVAYIPLERIGSIYRK